MYEMAKRGDSMKPVQPMHARKTRQTKYGGDNDNAFTRLVAYDLEIILL